MTPCTGKCRTPQSHTAGLLFQLGNTKWWLLCHGPILLSYSGSTEGPQTGQSPFVLGIAHHRSEHTDFSALYLLYLLEVLFPYSGQRKGKANIARWNVLTWVRSRNNRVNVEIREDAGTKWNIPCPFPQNVLQKLSAVCISSLSNLGFAPEAVNSNPTSSHLSPLSHTGTLNCSPKQALKLPERGFNSPRDLTHPWHPCLCFSHKLPYWPQC